MSLLRTYLLDQTAQLGAGHPLLLVLVTAPAPGAATAPKHNKCRMQRATHSVLLHGRHATAPSACTAHARKQLLLC